MVIITTKQGKRGAPVVSVNSMVGVQTVAHKIDMLDAYGYASLVQDARNNAYSDQMVSNNLRRQAQGLAPINFSLAVLTIPQGFSILPIIQTRLYPLKYCLI